MRDRPPAARETGSDAPPGGGREIRQDVLGEEDQIRASLAQGRDAEVRAAGAVEAFALLLRDAGLDPGEDFGGALTAFCRSRQ